MYGEWLVVICVVDCVVGVWVVDCVVGVYGVCDRMCDGSVWCECVV